MLNPSFQPDEPVWHTGLENGATKVDGDDVSAFKQPHSGSAVGEKPDELLSRTKYTVSKGYDPHDFGNQENATSFLGVVTHIIVISFGPTLLSIPAAFVNVGYVTGFVGTILTVFLYAYCMRMVVSCEYELCQRGKVPNMSYIGMIREAFKGGPARLQWCSKYVELIVYSVFLCIWVGGNSIVYLLAVRNLKNSYDFFAGSDSDIRLIMLVIVVPLVLLCWIPDLRLLVPVSFITNIINVFSICVILYYSLQDLPSLADHEPTGSIGSIPIFVGLLLFTINATGLMIPLKNELKKPKKFNSKFGVISISYVSVTLMYSLFGLLCFLKFGHTVQSSVIWNLPNTRFCKIVIGLYGIGNCCFYPLISYVSFDIFWNNILKAKLQKSPYVLPYEYLCRTLIALSSMIFAYIVPNIELFLSLTGTVGTSIDSLIIPALTQTLIYYDQRKYILHLKNTLIMLIGAFLIIAGCYDFTSQLINSF